MKLKSSWGWAPYKVHGALCGQYSWFNTYIWVAYDKFVAKTGHQIDMWYDEIGLCSNILSIPSPIVNTMGTIGRGLCDHFKSESSRWPLITFVPQLWFWNLMWLFSLFGIANQMRKSPTWSMTEEVTAIGPHSWGEIDLTGICLLLWVRKWWKFILLQTQTEFGCRSKLSNDRINCVTLALAKNCNNCSLLWAMLRSCQYWNAGAIRTTHSRIRRKFR